ncbi:MAG: hypothetical protein EP329_06450, partial [Deltaproteobacteria bacterium]
PYVQQIDAGLAAAGLAYAAPIGLIDRDYAVSGLGESALGDLVADAVRARATAVVTGSADARAIDVGLVLGLTLGDGLAMDPTTDPTTVRLADLFAAVPYGASPTAQTVPGWPLVEVYLDGEGLAQVLEVGLTLGALRGPSFWLDVSGVRVAYDPERPPFHRVTGLWIDAAGGANVCNAASNLMNSDGTLKNPGFRYRVATNLFAAGLLARLGELTDGGLTVIPRDAAGTPTDPTTRVVPGGVWGDELREWQALTDHVHALTTQAGGAIPPPSGVRWIDPATRSALCSGVREVVR